MQQDYSPASLSSLSLDEDENLEMTPYLVAASHRKPFLLYTIKTGDNPPLGYFLMVEHSNAFDLIETLSDQHREVLNSITLFSVDFGENGTAE